MMEGAKLWQQRFREWLKEFFRYGRFIFNDHLMILFVLAIGAGTYYYQDWVKNIPAAFPGELLFSVIFGLLLITGHITTFFQAPDAVFLLPAETRLKPYLIRSFFYTYLIQGFGIVLVSLILAPVYLETIHHAEFLMFFSFVLLLKILNLWIRWYLNYETDSAFIKFDRLLCLALNGSSLYLFLNGAKFLSFVVILILIAYGLASALRNRDRGLPWEQLIALEERRRMRFYRFANLFTDVPHLRHQVKRRKAFDFLIERIPFQRKQAEFYLFVRTFLRSGDYFGLYLRLTLIGGIIVWGLKGSIPGIGGALLFMYGTGFQLLGLWKHHDYILWSDVYPFEPAGKGRAFTRLLTILLSLQSLLFAAIFLLAGDFFLTAILIAVLGLAVYGFVYIYSWRRIGGSPIGEGKM